MRQYYLVPLVLGALAACSSPSSVPPSGGATGAGGTTGGSNAGGSSGTAPGTGGSGVSSGGAQTTSGGASATTGGATGTSGANATGGSTSGGASGTTGGVAGASNGGAPSTGGTSTGGSGATSSGGKAGGTSTGGSSGGGAGAPATGGAGGIVGGVIWPNDMSKANSDPWLVTNHDRITQLQPRVLVINLDTADATATTRIAKHVAALKEASSFHKYKDPTAQPALAYEVVKVAKATKGSRIDYNSWNTQAFADSNIQLKDPADPSGPNLTLCQLFEKGVINEVWCMASSDPKCGETQESKQVYDANGVKVANRFANASNGDNITGLNCKVTVRITDFNSGRGPGCHQHAMGHAWERYMDANAVPALGKQARRFLNFDLNTRVGAPFSNFYSACSSNGSQLTDCMVWDSNIHMRSGPSASRSFDIPDMSAGCGNAHFYANTVGTYSYDTANPDPEVLSSCENYGMKNGPNGKDLTTPYTNAMTDRLYGRHSQNCPANQPACDDDCGGHGTTYLYQNFPGPGTLAKNDDGTPMRNWWVYLFY